jgi:hypothetical protein
MVGRTHIVGRTSLVITLAIAFAASQLHAAEYYVAPTGGSDANAGSIGSPFATFTKAIATAAPGDTIFARGGTYNINTKLSIQKAGTAANPIKLFAFPGETPILDFANNPATAGSTAGRGIELNGNANWWHVKGLTIQNAKDNGFYTEGSNGLFEQIVTRNNRDSGFQLHGSAANNLVLNCDSFDNFDLQTLGENADGFAVKHEDIGPGNIFRGSRAWGNSDDGWDAYYTENHGILIQDCWSFDNGINVWGISDYAGDGNGFKLGRPGGPSILVNNLAVDNPHNGMDINGNTSGLHVYNSTSFRNERNWRFDQAVSTQVLKNNISFQGDTSDSINAAVGDTFNTWNGGVSLNTADFESLARVVDGVDLLMAARKADGSLPDLGGFLRLASTSDLINAGTPISFTFNGVNYSVPYNGAAPDLGAFEWSAPAPALPGDYNGDNIVDAADYVTWRDALGSSTALANDETPGSVDASDYEVWKANFGQTLGGSAAVTTGAVPEPGTMLLLALGAMACVIRRYR